VISTSDFRGDPEARSDSLAVLVVGPEAGEVCCDAVGERQLAETAPHFPPTLRHRSCAGALRFTENLRGRPWWSRLIGLEAAVSDETTIACAGRQLKVIRAPTPVFVPICRLARRIALSNHVELATWRTASQRPRTHSLATGRGPTSRATEDTASIL
jgi:hypothetical protein